MTQHWIVKENKDGSYTAYNKEDPKRTRNTQSCLDHMNDFVRGLKLGAPTTVQWFFRHNGQLVSIPEN